MTTGLGEPVMLLILFILSYIAGSINFSILLFKVLGKNDPRKSFSKNPGATNVYRQVGISWALLVLFLDAGRAVLVAIVSLYFLRPELVPFSGFGLIIGNTFPCFHGFKGGKGVANYLGFTIVSAPLSCGIAVIVWLIVYGVGRTPFISSFFMVVILSIGTILAFQFSPLAVLAVGPTVILIFFNHRQNIISFINRNNTKKNEA